MLSNCIIDIEKEIGRHIGLAKTLTERNEVLSSKVVDLELKLKERDGELQKERQTVEDHLLDKTKQSAEIERLKNRCAKLEKDTTLMKQTAQETKISSVVSNFSSAMTMNLKKISHLGILRQSYWGSPNIEIKKIVNSFDREVDNNVKLNETLRRENEQLKNTIRILEGNQRNADRLIEQNNALIQKMMKEQDHLKIEKNQHMDQLNAHQGELKQLIESFRDELRRKNEEIEEFRKQNEERNTVQLQNLKDSIEQKYFSIDRKVDSMQIRLNTLPGKFVYISRWYSKDCFSSDNVEQINFVADNLDSLVYSISSYRRELLIWTSWRVTSELADDYAKLLSLCKEWKRLRPDGEIHCLCWYGEGDSPSEPELASLLTTYNKYRYIDVASDISAVRQYWPKFANSILSEKTKNEYPK